MTGPANERVLSDVEISFFADGENRPCISAKVHDSNFIMTMKPSGRDSQGKFYLFKWNQQHRYFQCAERNNSEKFVKISFSQREMIFQNNDPNKSCVISGISDSFYDFISSVMPLGQSKKIYISQDVLNGFSSTVEPLAVMNCSTTLIHRQRRSSTRRTTRRRRNEVS
jgi:hypothetical protein